jgi:hypothetical protein
MDKLVANATFAGYYAKSPLLYYEILNIPIWVQVFFNQQDYPLFLVMLSILKERGLHVELYTEQHIFLGISPHIDVLSR